MADCQYPRCTTTAGGCEGRCRHGAAAGYTSVKDRLARLRQDPAKAAALERASYRLESWLAAERGENPPGPG